MSEPLAIPMVLRTEPMTRKQVRDFTVNNTPLLMLVQNDPKLSNAMHAQMSFNGREVNDNPPFSLLWDTNQWVPTLGKPLASMPDYESNPGLWLIDDLPTGITFCIWSDEHRKNSYKGTSIELAPTMAQKPLVHEAYGRLVEYMKAMVGSALENETDASSNKAVAAIKRPKP